MNDEELVRAIEAVVLVAVEPVPPGLLAELLEEPAERVEAACEQLAASYRDERRGFVLARVAGGYRFQTHPDLAAYVERFANRALPHRTAQVAMDGSQKLPQRLFGTIADRRRQGAEPLPALLCLAAWMRFVADRRDDSGRPLSVDDPLADDIATRVAGAGTAAGVVDALLGMRAVFDPELADDAVVRDRLVELLHRLRLDGAEATADFVASM